MIEIDKQLFKMYSSLEKLESLDKHYYKIDNYSIKNNRFILKADLVEDKKFDVFNCTCKTIHQYNIRDLYNIELYDYLMDRVGLLDIITSYRLRDSHRKKTERLKLKIKNIFENDNLFFLSFSFDNKKFRKKNVENVKQSTLRKYVQRWLTEYCIDYVGNVDYGGQYGRIHFHAVVSLKEEKVNHKTWKYGALNFEKITIKNINNISLYVNKLCAHALKESTKAHYLIYPKKIS